VHKAHVKGRMIEIYARPYLTPLNTSEDEMTNRMKRTNRINQLKYKIHKREVERFLNAEAQESLLLSERRESPHQDGVRSSEDW
jgi:hypothetical protein